MPYADPERRRECNRKWMTAYRVAKPESTRGALAKWKAKNAHYNRDRYRTSEQARIADNLRCTLSQVMLRRNNRDWVKGARLSAIVGCSRPALIAHIEAQFAPGMSWENYGRGDNYGQGGWEIDHRVPCASFDLTDPAQQAACFHYTNLRPLWRIDNMRRPRKEVAS